MNKFFLLLLITLSLSAGVFAQDAQTFLVKKASKIYDVKIKIENCEEELCDGKATVYLMKKNQAQIFQTFEMEEMYITREKNAEVYGIAFEDYNFDGVLDLAISNGYYKPYGGISYNVYLFDKAKNKFVEHEGLSALESENMSVDMNKKQRFIETMTKSGCCWHQTVRYHLVNNRLAKFYIYTEEWLDETNAEVTTERLVGKRWIKNTVKRRDK